MRTLSNSRGVLRSDLLPVLRQVLKDKLKAGTRGTEIALLESAIDYIEAALEESGKEL